MIAARQFRQRLFEAAANAANFANSSIVFLFEAARSFGENVLDDPDAMLNAVEDDKAVEKHQHGIVELQLVIAGRGNAFHEPDHVISKVADGAADEGRQAGHAHRFVSGNALAQNFDGIGFEGLTAGLRFDRAGAAAGAENFRGIESKKTIAANAFAALHAFEQAGIFRIAREFQVRGDRREHVEAHGIVHGNKIAAPRERTKSFEVRLEHSYLLSSDFSGRKAVSTTLRMTVTGALRPVQSSHCPIPWAKNISTPETVR